MYNKKGQNLLEYSLLFAVVISALLIMQVYVKRSYQGRLKRESDSLGQQYSPGHTASHIVSKSSSESVTYTGGTTSSGDLKKGGVVPDGNKVTDGMSVTYTASDSSLNRSEKVDSLAAE